ncbi:zinc finger and SCAN domain-containing protein 31-like [Gouania willdenowi]|uniref:Zinc finger and SCAN domain-containing protein 31-like n=1 Tax=Gouania willdenowi TaxID=441366 RepID=A0A8C5D2D4_GOUWI|nr:zinc finger and SCAN domain-containing protein 31-like [Gouania willdenowi]
MAQAKSKSFCCVPGCSCNAQKQPYLSFHSFPVNGETRRKWVQAIRREEGPTFTIKTGSTYVCSRHFTPEDYVLGITVRRLKPDSIPSLFLLNDYTSKGKRRSLSVYERCHKQQPLTSVGVEVKESAKKAVNLDHDYATLPSAALPADIQETSSPDGVTCDLGSEHFHIKEEQEELWENQESDIIAVIVKSEDEDEEEPQFSKLQTEEDDVIKIERDSSETEDSDAENYWTSNETPVSENQSDFNTNVRKSFGFSESVEQFCFKASAESEKLPFEKRYGCDVCSKRFNSKRDLIRHTFIHTGEKPFSCNICGLHFIQKSNLRAHFKIHSGEKPFDCKFCTKCFRRNTDLKRHMTVHNGEKPFSCDICEKRFSRKTHLKTHTIVHTGEKPFTCNICSKRFKQMTYLKVHTRVHTGERPFSCDICEQNFAHRHSLTVHRRVHAREKLSLDCSSLRKGGKHIHVSSSYA